MRYLLMIVVLAAIGAGAYWYFWPRDPASDTALPRAEVPRTTGDATPSPAETVAVPESDQLPDATRAETDAPLAAAEPEPVVRPRPRIVEAPDQPATAEIVATSDQPDVAGLQPVPTFDVVRIARDGNAVIAGRAEPGAEVTVLDQGEPIGRAVADPRGEWVLVPDMPIGPGTRQLTLEAGRPGEARIESVDTVVLAIPAPEADARQLVAVAVLTPRDAERPTRVLQGATGPVARAEGGPGVSFDVIDYDGAGNVVIAGRADPNTEVRVYSDNRLIGTTVSDAEGAWQLVPDSAISPGPHQLRVDTVKPGGEVVARITLPFQRAEQAIIELRQGQVIVQPGNSLWRIARATYGEGVRFTEILAANRDQIGDPDLIFPGQVFKIPASTN